MRWYTLPPSRDHSLTPGFITTCNLFYLYLHKTSRALWKQRWSTSHHIDHFKLMLHFFLWQLVWSQCSSTVFLSPAEGKVTLCTLPVTLSSLVSCPCPIDLLSQGMISPLQRIPDVHSFQYLSYNYMNNLFDHVFVLDTGCKEKSKRWSLSVSRTVCCCGGLNVTQLNDPWSRS